MVAFATPYAILILHQYGKLIPMELDESAKVDGARRCIVSTHLPAADGARTGRRRGLCAAAGMERVIYQLLLISSPRNMTVAVALDQFFDSDEAPWNYMMAVAIIYSLPPVAIYFGLRRFMVAGLTVGGIKG